MWPLIGFVAIMAGPLIAVLYGPRWADAAFPLMLLMVAQFIVLGFGMNWEVFALMHETRRQVKYESVRAVIGTAAFVFGATISLSWAAVGRVAEALVGYFLYRPHMDRLIGIEPGSMRRLYIEGTILTVTSLWPFVCVMIANRWQHQVEISHVIIAAIVSFCCWLATLKALDHPVLVEIRRAFLAIRGRQSV